MKKILFGAIALSALATPMAMPLPALAQDWHHDDRGGNGGDNGWHGGNDGNGGDHGWRGGDHNWDPANSYHGGGRGDRRLGRNDQVYRGHDGRYYCKRNDGTTGLVIGALGGGVAGNRLGGGTLGTLLGAGGGALLGRSIDRGNVKCR
ncbi:glycine zipper 2TM domain-containing protein [Sphingomonas abietis]|uniref:17 kDa surface antigen n=1 Tax=Sphingomonas abietis TaxID=3012344 RepID=A0ABY7NPC9_9SPHN|nr:glycine zipper 2TM domain-containing protein [Sphingomonas abietis]WBO22805.1 glycine zipper 2TM domain-containing protein [Sphingomonas abietis]